MRKTPLSKAITRPSYIAALRLPFYYSIALFALGGPPILWLTGWTAITLYIIFMVALYVGLRVGAHYDDRFIEALLISSSKIKRNSNKLIKHCGGDPYGF
ncbi:MAG: VirB3 family type IV secretion system protein [Rhizobiales bacterium]|nr:VirB3 family type IV secretion system protein [Hyphomicrobiales bacterium]